MNRAEETLLFLGVMLALILISYAIKEWHKLCKDWGKRESLWAEIDKIVGGE